MIQLTTIAVKDDTWQELNKLKKLGDSMDDVIKELLENYNQNHLSDDDTEDNSFTHMTENQFNALLDDLIPDDEKEFEKYLEKSRESFARGI